MFALGWFFARSIENGLREVQHWLVLILGVVIGGILLYRYYRGRKKAGLAIGPSPLEVEDLSLTATKDDTDSRRESSSPAAALDTPPAPEREQTPDPSSNGAESSGLSEAISEATRD